MNHQLTAAEAAYQKSVNACDQSHTWHSTIMLVSVQCRRRTALASWIMRVSMARCKPLVGVCQRHRHLNIPETEEEVL